jgi:hypothetical protein
VGLLVSLKAERAVSKRESHKKGTGDEFSAEERTSVLVLFELRSRKHGIVPRARALGTPRGKLK